MINKAESDTYPQILIHPKLNKIKSSYPKTPSPPIKPSEPSVKEPKKPIKVGSGSGMGSAILIVLILVILGIFSGGLTILFAIGLIFYWMKNWNRMQADRKKSYQKYLFDLKEYECALRNKETIYNRELKEYKTKELPDYEKELFNYENKKAEINSETYIENFRKREVKKYFQSSEVPKKNENKYSRGVSEPYFLRNLVAFFGKNVFTNHSVVCDDFEGVPFNPDFVIYDPEWGIYIDIEVDEPYIGKDGTPIHYIGNNDGYRNTFFLENNWIVIRFSEFQIIKYPQECCKVIKAVIENIKSNKKISIQNIRQLVESYPRWTKEEANKLAYIKYRNDYLPMSLKENITTEIKELEIKFQKTKIYDDLPF